MVDISSIIEGTVKFRDGKKWKSRWCVMRKLSPVADCLHLQLYRDSKDRYKQGQTKASLSLEHFLGIELGFTLDKESNTIAIICQDVIVVLAFDTREKLMQWQVKISNHLGDDLQYLVLVSSAPPKSKLQTGPSRLHIQNHRFCLTTGVPPKLVGLWDIAYLRRYGVVDNRFCFEGGSRCGKGEGLYIFITDQAEEITQTLKSASQAKLSTKKRQMSRELESSPRKLLSPSYLETIDDGFSGHINDSSCACGSRIIFWPSQESRYLNYGCGDSTSISEYHDSFNDCEVFSKNTKGNLERCMSCMSTLGDPSMSRSSTGIAHANADANHSNLWTIVNDQSNSTTKSMVVGVDRMSICSSHGSSGGYGSSSSEYSVPRMKSMITSTLNTGSCHKSIPLKHCLIPNNSSCNSCSKKQYGIIHNNSQQARNPNTQTATPFINSPNCITPHFTDDPYENYDIPKISLPVESNSNSALAKDNYDTPKNIQEYLPEDVNRNNSTVECSRYYDIPAQVRKKCLCLNDRNHYPSASINIKDDSRNDCTCNRVMSWADNWISLPYCRRGNSIEKTEIPINKVKLSGEGKMPVMQPTGKLAVYATVDFSKKSKKKHEDETCNCAAIKDNEGSETNSSNYINLDPSLELSGSINDRDKSFSEKQLKTKFNSANYTNFDFAQSLENYENSKELLYKAGITVEEIEELQSKEMQNFCKKCGHTSNKISDTTHSEEVHNTELLQKEYLTMDTTVKSESSTKFSGYLPMSPAPYNAMSMTTMLTTPLLSSNKELSKKVIVEKSASNPSLNGPAVSKKQIEQVRISGSTLVLFHQSAVNPQSRKEISTESLINDKNLSSKKRSSSAGSRFLENPEDFDSLETLRRTSLSQIEGIRSSSPCLNQEIGLYPDEAYYTKVFEAEDDSSLTSTSQSQNSQSVHIRRSASVPCKTQNRDSSSSNDSGVSTGSLRHRASDFHEFELPLTTAMSIKRHQKHIKPFAVCIHSTLPRRSKSFDPLREISFQFQKSEYPGKSTSAEAEVPLCPPNSLSFTSPCETVTTAGGQPYIDSRSTSSGTSDMSDYIETLSLSSHSSSDATENLKLLRQATVTLRPRSGKEYQNIDRSLISLTNDSFKQQNHLPVQLKGLLPCSSNYTNITPVPENNESPSPGYQNGI